MSDAVSETIVIKCGCGTNMRVRANAAGKKAKCPKCGGIMTIPAIAAAPRIVLSAPAPSPDAVPSDLSDLLPIEPAPSAEPTGGMRCPQCKIMMATGAKICISCGYNVETGKTLKTSDGAPGKIATAAKAMGTFALGTTLSAVGAAIGGVVWFLVAYYGHFEVGYIAWGVGVLAGLGMYLGYRQPEAKAGIVAAGMSALGIIGAKLTIFVIVVSSILPLFDPTQIGVEEQRNFIAKGMAEGILDDRGITSDEKRAAQYESALKEANDEVKNLSDEEVRALCKEYRQQLDDAIGANKNFLTAFIQDEFTLFDGLWFFLALGSAYRIGCGTPVGET